MTRLSRPLKEVPKNGYLVVHRGWVWLAALAMSGCASQGPLRPPSLHLPAPVKGLVADRVGNAVDLRWTAPTRTTDGLPLSGKHVPTPLQVEICREVASAACSSLGRISLGSAASGSFHDVLPIALTSGPPKLLIYRVRVLNGRGGGASPASIETVAGAAPAPLEHVEAAPAENGVLIRWQSVSGNADVRILLRVKRGAPADRTSSTAGGTGGGDTLLAVDSKAGESAGALDTGAKRDVAQRYSIVRQRTVHLGGKDFSMTGQPVLVSVAADAKLPPVRPPDGLEAIVNTLGAPEIDLVWQPGASAASGYRIFRAEGAGSSVLLTAEPVRGLAYSDVAVRPGARYRYSVASVDQNGDSGPKSGEIEEQVPDR